MKNTSYIEIGQLNKKPYDTVTSCVDVSIIIPSYQEEDNLKLILPRLKSVLQSLTINLEVLIVDTMSPRDNTKQICENYGVMYLNRESSDDYGDAVRTGIKYCIGKKIIFMDADGSHEPEFILELLKHKDIYDIVIASRYIKGGGIENSLSLIFMSRVLNLTYSFILKINCKDLSNSYKLYDAEQLKSQNFYCNNFDIVEEIIYKIVKNNKLVKIIELPYFFKKRICGKTKRNLFLFILSYLLTILRLRFGK